jgi:two-component system chemotaxis response regulator CheY
MTVLVVDDDAGTRELIRRALQRDLDVRILEADNGATALELLAAERVDLLLLDIRMRVMDGLQTLEAIRRTPAYASVCVFILTGMADEKHVTHAMRLGVTNFLVKPLTPSTLRERVSRALADMQVPTDRDNAARLDLTPNHRVILLDAEPEFHASFRDAVTLCRIEATESEAAALVRCEVHEGSAAGPLAALFIGATVESATGSAERLAFIERVHHATHPQRIPIVALVPSADLEDTRKSGLYDAAVTRSFDSGALMRSLTPLLNESSLARLLFDPASPSVIAILQAACKLLGESLNQSITVRTQEQLIASAGTSRWIFSSVHLQSAHGTWELCVHLPFTVALRVGAASHQLDPDQLSTAEVRDVVLNLALQLGTQLRDESFKSGVQFRLASGRTGELPTGALFRALERSTGMARGLFGRQEQPAGAIQLIPHTVRTTAN